MDWIWLLPIALALYIFLRHRSRRDSAQGQEQANEWDNDDWDERQRHRPIQASKTMAASDEWVAVEIPPNRPAGKWVNWKFESGWIKVKGTTSHTASVAKLARELNRRGGPRGSLLVELRREPENAYDENAISVTANLSGAKTQDYMLGYLEAEAAEWLAETFADTMPIAAEMVRFRTNFEAASITVCGLMPPKKQRLEFEIEADEG